MGDAGRSLQVRDNFVPFSNDLLFRLDMQAQVGVLGLPNAEVLNKTILSCRLPEMKVANNDIQCGN